MLDLETPLFISIFMFGIGFIGIVAYPPQIKALYKSKSSVGMTMKPWITWAITYIFFGTYAFVFTSSIVLVLVNIIELVLCIWIAGLIYKYREGGKDESEYI